jgi:hypothetical protein
MKKYMITAVAVGAVCVLAFWWGRQTSICNCDAAKINEIHFVNPKYLRRVEPSFQVMLTNMLRDSFRNIKPPYTNEKIKQAIGKIERKTHLKNFIKVLKIDSASYKILVTNDDTDPYSIYLLITNRSYYFMKPLNIIKDLRPSDRYK